MLMLHATLLPVHRLTTDFFWPGAPTADIVDATRQLLDGGARVVRVERLATETGVSVVTIRTHWAPLATTLHLRSITQRCAAPLARGGTRDDAR